MNEATNICAEGEKLFQQFKRKEEKALNYFGKFWKNQACVYQRVLPLKKFLIELERKF
jgi:hypothetical protein